MVRLNKNKQKFSFPRIIYVLTIICFFYLIFDKYFAKKDLRITDNQNTTISDKNYNYSHLSRKDDAPQQIPENAFIDLPFITQSPFAVWDALGEDACEEASLLMIYYLINNRNNISKTEADQDIKAMVAYENSMGYSASITLSELNNIAQDYLNIKNGEVKKNITIDNIKKEISTGKPVIVGAAGKLLKNPNFRNGGPNYHMLVITGYDKDGFITNDPGTRKGENFRYDYENLYDSIKDWNEDNILYGEKNYLVFD